MKKELIIRADELDNAKEIIEFFRSSEFDAETMTVESESMSGHVMEIPYIKITKKE